MERFGRPDDNVGFVDYQPAPWLAPEDRVPIESTLAALGYGVIRGDDMVHRYLDV
jgi:hypothetical protein